MRCFKCLEKFRYFAKCFKYLAYLFRHKWHVFIECCKYRLIWQGIIHDLSKFLPSEFFPYLNHFYNKKYQQQDIYLGGQDTKFDFAWMKHLNRNRHHWQYWIFKEESGKTNCLLMPDKYWKEMLADWRGMEKTLHSKATTKEWYLAHKSKIMIHKETRRRLEKELGIN